MSNDQINALKLANLNQQRKQVFQQLTNAIAALNSQADVALKLQAYMRKNPDNNGADGMVSVSSDNFAAAKTAYAQAAGKLADLIAVNDNSLPVDDTIAKYNIDVAAVSDSLL